MIRMKTLFFSMSNYCLKDEHAFELFEFLLITPSQHQQTTLRNSSLFGKSNQPCSRETFALNTRESDETVFFYDRGSASAAI